MSATLPPRRRWFQFGLGTMFGMVTFVALLLAWRVSADKSRFVPLPSDSEERILAALEEPTNLQFQNTPLSDVVSFIHKQHKIEIQFDRKALSDLSLDPQFTAITESLDGIKLKSALKLILKPLDLTFMVDDDLLLITSQTEAEETLITRTYPVGDLVDGRETGGYAPLISLITNVIEPDTWEETEGGAPGKIMPAVCAKSLVISQKREVHDQVLELLRSLRAVAPVTTHSTAQRSKTQVPNGGLLRTESGTTAARR